MVAIGLLIIKNEEKYYSQYLPGSDILLISGIKNEFYMMISCCVVVYFRLLLEDLHSYRSERKLKI